MNSDIFMQVPEVLWDRIDRQERGSWYINEFFPGLIPNSAYL